MNDLVSAEWLKLRTTRLLQTTVPLAVLLSLAAVAGAVISLDGTRSLESDEGIQRVLSVTGAGAIVVLVLGILVAAGEQRHGTAVDTYLTTPRRGRVVAAKLMVGAAVGGGLGLVVTAAALALSAVLYAVEGAALPVDDTGLWASLLGAVVYITLFAVLGVAIGVVARDQVLAVAVSLAWLAILEHTLVGLVPDVGRWLPVAAGQAVVRTPVDDLLDPVTGAAVLAFYAVALTIAALQVVGRRDV